MNLLTESSSTIEEKLKSDINDLQQLHRNETEQMKLKLDLAKEDLEKKLLEIQESKKLLDASKLKTATLISKVQDLHNATIQKDSAVAELKEKIQTVQKDHEKSLENLELQKQKTVQAELEIAEAIKKSITLEEKIVQMNIQLDELQKKKKSVFEQLEIAKSENMQYELLCRKLEAEKLKTKEDLTKSGTEY